MGEACANPASYNLCGPAVSWTKSGMCDVRALNRARDCMFLCAGKWFAWWILDFFIASFPAKEHRAETMRIFSLPCWLCFLDKRSLSFSIQLLANREVPQARAKTQGQKKKKNHDREKHDCPQPYSSVWKTQLSVKGTLDQSFHRLAHFWVSAKGTLSTVNLYVSYGHVCVCVCVCVCRWGWGTGLKAIAIAQTGWELIFVWNRMHSELDKMKNFIQHFSERSHTRSPGSASRATNATEAT